MQGNILSLRGRVDLELIEDVKRKESKEGEIEKRKRLGIAAQLPHFDESCPQNVLSID